MPGMDDEDVLVSSALDDELRFVERHARVRGWLAAVELPAPAAPVGDGVPGDELGAWLEGFAAGWRERFGARLGEARADG